MAEKVCCCCGRPIKADYEFCIGCERKRLKVIESMVRAGYRYSDAVRKADESYPRRYA